jgi:hypothetical protein
MANVRSIVLSYTFFRTGDAEVLGLADEVRKQQGGGLLAPGAAPDDGTREKIRQWAEGMAQMTGVAISEAGPVAGQRVVRAAGGGGKPGDAESSSPDK